MQLQQYNQDCFKQSGYLAASPTQVPLQVGDFAQVEQGQVQVLGNLSHVNFPNEIAIGQISICEKGIPWVLSAGVERQQKLQQSDILGTEQASLGSWQKYRYQFNRPQNFIFHGREGLCERICNWSQIRDEVTLRLTQSHHSFRQVMVITDVLKFEQWGLAIAAKANGLLELAMQHDDQRQADDAHFVLSHQQRITQNNRDMYFVGCGDQEQHLFYRAKMLRLSDTLEDKVRIGVMENAYLTPTMRANWLNGNLINALPAANITINNCIDSFVWCDATVDML